MAIKKHKLKSSQSSSDFLNLGIATSDSEFQVSQNINSLLNIKLSLSKSITKETKKGEVTFPCFIYNNEENLHLTLLKNKSQGMLLFNTQSAFDYIITISGESKSNAFEILQKQLKSVANISVVSAIKTNKLTGLKSVI